MVIPSEITSMLDFPYWICLSQWKRVWGHHGLRPCCQSPHRRKHISAFPKILSSPSKLKPHNWSKKSFCRYHKWMLAVCQQRDGFSIFDEDITGDFVEMESNDKEAQSSSYIRMHGKRKKLGAGGGWLIEQVKYTEREEGCLLMLPANGERQ